MHVSRVVQSQLAYVRAVLLHLAVVCSTHIYKNMNCIYSYVQVYYIYTAYVVVTVALFPGNDNLVFMSQKGVCV